VRGASLERVSAQGVQDREANEAQECVAFRTTGACFRGIGATLSPRAHPHKPALSLSPSPRTGKTTLLRHLLEKSGLKIGCVVNDVASVNIDAKLVRNDRARAGGGGGGEGGGAGGKTDGGAPTTTTADLADTVELANGCACAF
jgi:hypothetical protein